MRGWKGVTLSLSPLSMLGPAMRGVACNPLTLVAAVA